MLNLYLQLWTSGISASLIALLPGNVPKALAKPYDARSLRGYHYRKCGREVLLLLRDDKPDISFPNHWTLVGGKAEDGETPKMAAHRELDEETGLKAELSFWKRYDRQHPNVIVDRFIYVGRVNASLESIILGEGQDVRFFKSHDIKHL